MSFWAGLQHAGGAQTSADRGQGDAAAAETKDPAADQAANHAHHPDADRGSCCGNPATDAAARTIATAAQAAGHTRHANTDDEHARHHPAACRPAARISQCATARRHPAPCRPAARLCQRAAARYNADNNSERQCAAIVHDPGWRQRLHYPVHQAG